MHKPLTGIKMVEVAQFTFTPAAGAVLTEWGAEVIKVEHAEMGDAQRGMRSQPRADSWHPVMDHPNRGKKSIGLALEQPAAYEVLMDLCRDADVFLTNFLPDARRRLRLDVEDIRKANPNIVYVRGSAHGQRGPWAERGGFDGSSFWCRMGSAWGVTPTDSDRLITMPAGAYGDTTGGMAIAGGIAAALVGRAQTGEPSVVDVSLMSVGAWAFALEVGNADLLGPDNPGERINDMMSRISNPTVGSYKTSDGRWINLTIMQSFRYFPDLCRHLGLDELIDDERFNTAEKLMANGPAAGALVAEAFRAQSYAFWVEHLQTLQGQWAPVQGPLDILDDPQMSANGYLVPVVDVAGNQRRLVTNPVQFDETPPETRRGPLFAEHTDDLLRELGRTEEEILQMKIDGACT
ncbi:CaiB/BaiF CoA transferase family protein [Parafrankia sp. FMc2]|uniref:CaiB/BaiF CoA transferase family protein n=1 Tax=Parafrankia sp. FMc2 TaxID=3233196 RepID=UPI0034D6E242